MPNRDELEAAISAGVIGRAEAERLAAFLAQYRAGHGMQAEAGEDSDDAEAVGFVRGFHDIFLAIGVTLLLIGVAYTSSIVARAACATAIAAWGLAEYFTRMKRLTLPSIALSLAFGLACGAVAGMLTGQLDAAYHEGTPSRAIPLLYKMPALGALLGSALFYLRFHLPFTLAQIAAATAVTVGLFVAPQGGQATLIFMIMGLLTFAGALYFDLRDPHRRTIAADNAFWLHLTAAPLIVHTTMSYVWAGGGAANMTLTQAVLTIAVIFTLAFVALVIDRRALLVAGLTYFGVALFIIIRNAAIDENTVLALTILILGGALVLLGAGWRRLRAAVIETLMPPDLARRLPTLRPE
jgi:hypothetical protein